MIADIKYRSKTTTSWRLRMIKAKQSPTLKDITDGIFKKNIECIDGTRYLYKYDKCTISDMDESENIKRISDAYAEKISDCAEKMYSIKEE